MIVKDKRILVLAPHPDDGEFGCGGTLAKWKDSGAELYYIAFSNCEQSVPKEFSKDILSTELKNATGVLGVAAGNLQLLNYEVRKFNSARQEILEELVKVRKSISPEIVFMPSFDDFHQDHLTIAQEGVRAFKHSTILSYEVPWNNTSFKTVCFSKLDEAQLTKKIQAVCKYESQAFRSYATPDFITSLAKVRGVQAGTTYAEAFDVVRLHV